MNVQRVSHSNQGCMYGISCIMLMGHRKENDFVRKGACQPCPPSIPPKAIIIMESGPPSANNELRPTLPPLPGDVLSSFFCISISNTSLLFILHQFVPVWTKTKGSHDQKALLLESPLFMLLRFVTMAVLFGLLLLLSLLPSEFSRTSMCTC